MKEQPILAIKTEEAQWRTALPLIAPILDAEGFLNTGSDHSNECLGNILKQSPSWLSWVGYVVLYPSRKFALYTDNWTPVRYHPYPVKSVEEFLLNPCIPGDPATVEKPKPKPVYLSDLFEL